jgi:hypothetical protein
MVQAEDPPNRLISQPHNPPITFIDTWQDIPPFPLWDLLFWWDFEKNDLRK